MGTKKTITVDQRLRIFNILKSIVESKVPPLKALARDIPRLQREIRQTTKDVNDLTYKVEAESRYSVRDAEETAESLAWYENRLSDLKSKERLANAAKVQLGARDNFNNTYELIARPIVLRRLKEEQQRLVDSMDVLSDRIDNAAITIDTAEYRDAATVDAATDEMTHAQHQYDVLSSRYAWISKQIREMGTTRTK